MKALSYRNIVIRDYNEDDYLDVINLKLKEKDEVELYNMAKLTSKEYLEWHLDTYWESTKVVLLSGIIIGILGVSNGTIYFTTAEVSRGASINYVRMFKPAIEAIMVEAGIKELITYVDATYESAVKWDELCGFKKIKEVLINNNLFYIMKYKLP